MRIGTLWSELNMTHPKICMCIGHLTDDWYRCLVYSQRDGSTTIQWLNLKYSTNWTLIDDVGHYDV